MELSWLFAPCNCRALRSVVFVMAWASGATSLESSCLNCVSLPVFWRLEVAYDSWCFDCHGALDKTGDLQETLLDMQEAIFCDVYFFSYPTMAQAIGSMFCPFSHTHTNIRLFSKADHDDNILQRTCWSLVDCTCIYIYTYRLIVICIYGCWS